MNPQSESAAWGLGREKVPSDRRRIDGSGGGERGPCGRCQSCAQGAASGSLELEWVLYRGPRRVWMGPRSAERLFLRRQVPNPANRRRQLQGRRVGLPGGRQLAV